MPLFAQSPRPLFEVKAPAMDHASLGFEVKFAADAKDGEFTGYGAVFGNLDSYSDVIQKGAFSETLRDAKRTKQFPAMLLQHGGFGAEDMTPVGIWLDMEEDDIGLKVHGKLATGTQRGRDCYELLKMEPRPAITGLSIGFRAKEFTVGTKPKEPRRLLKAIDLFEVSLVTFPANGKARIDAVKGVGMTERQFEQLLMRDAGFSASEAKAIIAGGFKALKRERDAGVSEAGLIESLTRAAAMFRAS